MSATEAYTSSLCSVRFWHEKLSVLYYLTAFIHKLASTWYVLPVHLFHVPPTTVQTYIFCMSTYGQCGPSLVTIIPFVIACTATANLTDFDQIEIGPAFPSLGSLILTFPSFEMAMRLTVAMEQNPASPNIVLLPSIYVREKNPRPSFIAAAFTGCSLCVNRLRLHQLTRSHFWSSLMGKAVVTRGWSFSQPSVVI